MHKTDVFRPSRIQRSVVLDSYQKKKNQPPFASDKKLKPIPEFRIFFFHFKNIGNKRLKKLIGCVVDLSKFLFTAKQKSSRNSVEEDEETDSSRRDKVTSFTCDFTEFLHDLRFAFGFGNVAHKEPQVGDANVNFQVSPAFHFHIIQLCAPIDCLF